MANIFNLPDVGEGMAEGEVAEWLVKVGDEVEEGQPIVEIQNDKLLQEILSPFAGKVTKIFVEAGTVSKVGDPLIEFDGDGSDAAPTAAPAPAQEAAPEQPAAPSPVATTAAEPVTPFKLPAQTTNGRVLAMPSVRRFAFENDVDLTQVTGTGRRGHITKADVEAFINNGGAGASVAATAPAAEASVASSTPASTSTTTMTTTGEQVQVEERTPLSGMRKAISKAMTTSKHTAPHVTVFDEVEVSALINHRTKFKTVAAEQDIKLTYLPYIVKALVAVVKKYPVLNATLDDATQEAIYKKYYNIGIATDTEQGLYVPNIKDADRKSIFNIASEISTHAAAAHAGELKGADMKGGTITISNIGSAGGMWFTPIINYPEVAILGIGRIEKQPIIDENEELVVGNMMKLSLSFDHRLIDGMTAQLAMNELKRLLKDPERLLMEV